MLSVALALQLQIFGLDDVLIDSEPSKVHVGGYIGQRILNNEQNRLLEVDLKPLLEGFHKQPGSHPWIGEHIGKWIHASTLAWQNTGDQRLKSKLDKAVQELISCQQPDGYLGTYTPDKRFGLYEGADWDVWTHKYDLIGLLTYYQYTRDPATLTCCQRIGDLLINTFGPGKKSILSAGTHVGMAATSVLEPVVLLYDATRDKRYLDFAKYIVASWEEPGGPQILSRLEAGRPINEVGNGKAYEMLSNLVGLCELARATGEKRYLKVAKLAWADVVKHELYITGSASYYEHFHPGYDLPNITSKNVGETCVTVTWMQLCQQLLLLTGEAKYAEEFERSEYNHLAAAQRPDGKEWCYYTSLQGNKPYTHDTCCCLSSGPRGIALIPQTAYLRESVQGRKYVVVNTLESSSAKLTIDLRSDPELTMKSSFPSQGKATLTVNPNYHHQYLYGPAYRNQWVEFGLKIRVPSWATKFKCSVEGKQADGWYVISPRKWKKQTLQLSYELKPRTIDGVGSNTKRSAMAFGPFVMARIEKPTLQEASQFRKRGVPLIEFFDQACFSGKQQWICHVPFADANQKYVIWESNDPNNVPEWQESRSDDGNVDGSITDNDPGTFVVTFNGKPQKEAWFMLSRNSTKLVSRFKFTHGQNFHDGGWFVNDGNGPRIEIQRKVNGPWVSLGKLPGYPATTFTSPADLKPGQSFELKLDIPIDFVAVRVIGTPASGDNPKQAFASCGELQVFP